MSNLNRLLLTNNYRVNKTKEMRLNEPILHHLFIATGGFFFKETQFINYILSTWAFIIKQWTRLYLENDAQ